MSWKSTIAKKPTWKDSIMRSKPVTAEEMKADVLKLVMPEIKEKTSWKNTLSIVPKNGLDGKNGKDGKRGPKGDKGDQGPQGLAGKDGANGVDGKNGIDGRDGATWHLVSDEPEDIGFKGDFAFNKSSFEIYFKEDEWKKLGSIKGENKTAFVGGLNGSNGLSAYEVAVKNGFVGTEQEWLDSLQGSGGGGGTSRIVNTITTNTTLAAASNTDYIYFVDNAVTATMPTAIGNENQYFIKAISSTALVDFSLGQTGDGSSSLSLLENDSITLISDGANWRII